MQLQVSRFFVYEIKNPYKIAYFSKLKYPFNKYPLSFSLSPSLLFSVIIVSRIFISPQKNQQQISSLFFIQVLRELSLYLDRVSDSRDSREPLNVSLIVVSHAC